MRSVKIEHIEYEQYSRIVDAFVEHEAFWALAGSPLYRPNLKAAVFWFSDGDYVPIAMQQFAAKIQGNAALIDVVNQVVVEVRREMV